MPIQLQMPIRLQQTDNCQSSRPARDGKPAGAKVSRPPQTLFLGRPDGKTIFNSVELGPRERGVSYQDSRWGRMADASRAEDDPDPESPEIKLVVVAPQVRSEPESSEEPGPPASGTDQPEESAQPTPTLLGDSQAFSPELSSEEKAALDFIETFLKSENQDETSKLSFLKSVSLLCQAEGVIQGHLESFCSKEVLVQTLQALILQEMDNFLPSSVLPQTLLCIADLSQVKPGLHPLQKQGLIEVSIGSLFSLPCIILLSPDPVGPAALYIKTVNALSTLLSALLVENSKLNMLVLQDIVEVTLPWLASDKVHERARAVGTLAQMLKFVDDYPVLKHMDLFSLAGKLTGSLSLCCIDLSQEICLWSSQALSYFFSIITRQRYTSLKTTRVDHWRLMRDCEFQKNIHSEWFTNTEDIVLLFQKFLSPEERADMLLAVTESMRDASRHNSWVADMILHVVLKPPLPRIGKNFSYPWIQKDMQKIFHLLTQRHPEDVIWTLMEYQDLDEHRELWRILASDAKTNQEVLSVLKKKLWTVLAHETEEGDSREPLQLTTIQATEALSKLLLQAGCRREVPAFYPTLLVALLYQLSFLVACEDREKSQEQQGEPASPDLMSCTLQVLKTLIRCVGNGDQVTYVQLHGGWNMLSGQQSHLKGISLLGSRSMVEKNPRYNPSLFRLLFQILQEGSHESLVPTMTFFTELLRSSDVAALVDESIIGLMESWMEARDPAVHLLTLRAVANLGLHQNTEGYLLELQPVVLSCCCYSKPEATTREALAVLRHIIHMADPRGQALHTLEIAAALHPFFDDESEDLRLAAIETYGALMDRLRGLYLEPRVRRQVLSSLVPLVLHLEDENVHVAQECRLALLHIADVLFWAKLRRVLTHVLAQGAVWRVSESLLEEGKRTARLFLSQTLGFFTHSQASIRRVAVWFVGLTIRHLDVQDEGELERVFVALRRLQGDPDLEISCLASQTLLILEAREKQSPCCRGLASGFSLRRTS
ncbi:maestro heat-like repeat-containing protein family member 7 isoform X4 [Ornithorhynchus anatinus]|uniref:maestro heat-like repeat-containing protein family member 7 isoform X4 n=1 Tax=Ornithorhynchus anatinus TaxID=9258 RepID=UPI0019D4329E|nr:maestro heat-like repeat-containing protein family member 7 isoform X4 [Ornithorhynchus anatinus]